jgi:ubiquinone/menaquinone biosynthesis C-methylase UbiE
METSNSPFICCPTCKHELCHPIQEPVEEKTGGIVQCLFCDKEYQTRDGFIQFIKDEDVFRSSRREEIIRNIYARFYKPLTRLMFIPCGGERRARLEVLENLEITLDSLVLETGIGIGDNISYLNGILHGRPYYGLDNQQIMLRECRKNSYKWRQPVQLYRANAEELPFKDNSFDVVFHLGAINLFKDKKGAIDEMIRVAKPGTRIVIADESEKASELFAIFVGHHDPVVPPVDLIPPEMLEISLKSIWNDYGYLIKFRKPR